MKPFLDLRQSNEWGEYLKFLKWEIQHTTTGILVPTRQTVVGSLVKVQRPKVFTVQELKEIEAICSAKKAAFIKIEPTAAQDLKVLENNGYVVSYMPQVPPTTMLIDLTKSESDLWNNVSHSGKYSIKRALREGTRIEFHQNPSEDLLRPYQKLSEYTGRTKHFYVQPYAELKVRVDIFKDNAVLALAYDKDNNLISGKFFLAKGNVALYITGGTSQIGQKQKGGYALMWESFKYLKSKGFEVLDLEGMDDARFSMYTKSWGGFSHFKDKFGGEVVQFPYPYIKYINPFLKFMAKVSRIYSL